MIPTTNKTGMNIAELEKLNKRFSFEKDSSRLCFETGKGDMPVVVIKNEQASAVIALQGAHLLSWMPAGEDEVIWLSEDATFAPGKSVRGGIPICWPWFGAHEHNGTYPAHGFARTVMWQVTDTQQLPTGETQITFRLDTTQIDEKNMAMWPRATLAEYRLTIAKTLILELTTFNPTEQDITISQALHTYFRLDDITTTTVYGLEGKEYLDKIEGFKRKTQSGPVKIDTEVDRVYLQTADDVVIDGKKRRIQIKKQGSQSTVVWNPWKIVADKMGDLGEAGYLYMLCVESANVVDDSVCIKPGKKHSLRVSYDLEAD